MPTTTADNKIKFNLKNVHVAILTKSDQGEYTYATPVALPGAVNMSMEAQGESTPFYADGIVYQAGKRIGKLVRSKQHELLKYPKAV